MCKFQAMARQIYSLASWSEVLFFASKLDHIPPVELRFLLFLECDGYSAILASEWLTAL